MGALEQWERDRLDDLLARLLAVLNQPDLTGRRAGSALESRRAEALRLTTTDIAADRVRHAPRAYLLAQSAETAARHAQLLDPAPRRGRLRVTVTTIGNDLGRVEVAALDQPGLLAAVTGVLASRRIDVVEAAAVTWPDGAVVESYTVRTVVAFSTAVGTATHLEQAILDALRTPVAAEPAPDLGIDFDSDASPWYTLCEVRGPDRPGLLHAVTLGFAAANVTVHSARIETVGGVVIDRFDLTDPEGRKLDGDLRRTVREAIWSGRGTAEAPGARRRFFRKDRTPV
jgi:UTP:GlnB (protein PII) uridylyltransferase